MRLQKSFKNWLTLKLTKTHISTKISRKSLRCEKECSSHTKTINRDQRVGRTIQTKYRASDPQSVVHCLASREDWITKRPVKMKYLLCLSLLLFIHQILAGPVAPQEGNQLPRTGRTFSGNSTEDIFNDLSRLLQAWILIFYLLWHSVWNWNKKSHFATFWTNQTIILNFKRFTILATFSAKIQIFDIRRIIFFARKSKLDYFVDFQTPCCSSGALIFVVHNRIRKQSTTKMVWFWCSAHICNTWLLFIISNDHFVLGYSSFAENHCGNQKSHCFAPCRNRHWN